MRIDGLYVHQHRKRAGDGGVVQTTVWERSPFQEDKKTFLRKPDESGQRFVELRIIR